MAADAAKGRGEEIPLPRMKVVQVAKPNANHDVVERDILEPGRAGCARLRAGRS
jgi:hypothetical protein